MKKYFQDAELEIIRLSFADILTTSTKDSDAEEVIDENPDFPYFG